MDAVEIRDDEVRTASLTGRLVTVLPPREGFSPQAVGAIGLLVHRLGQPGDVVVGQFNDTPTFADPRFVPAETRFWPPVGRVGRYMAGVVRSVRRLRPELIEVHNRANLAIRLSRACPDCRVVLFVHNDPQSMREARSPAERAALLRRVSVVCVSRYLAGRFMEGLDAAGPSPLVLPNAIDLSEVPACLPAAARDKQILFVGRVVADKGADAFVQACAAALPLLPGWGATMIGADRFGVAGSSTAFEAHVLPLARAAGIELSGYQPHDAVLRAMARAAILVVPSRWAEPFGLTALEGMACGAALVCSLRGGLPEVVGGAALPADPDAPGVLTDAILRLARDPALRARLSAEGLQRAQGFDAPAARARLAELRARLLAT